MPSNNNWYFKNLSPKKKILVLIAVFVFLIIFGVISFSRKKEGSFLRTQHKVFNSKELSTAEYVATKEEFLEMIAVRDPKFALTELRDRIKTDDALLHSCHALVHDIGRAAYEKYQDF